MRTCNQQIRTIDPQVVGVREPAFALPPERIAGLRIPDLFYAGMSPVEVELPAGRIEGSNFAIGKWLTKEIGCNEDERVQGINNLLRLSAEQSDKKKEHGDLLQLIHCTKSYGIAYKKGLIGIIIFDCDAIMSTQSIPSKRIMVKRIVKNNKPKSVGYLVRKIEKGSGIQNVRGGKPYPSFRRNSVKPRNIQFEKLNENIASIKVWGFRVHLDLNLSYAWVGRRCPISSYFYIPDINGGVWFGRRRVNGLASQQYPHPQDDDKQSFFHKASLPYCRQKRKAVKYHRQVREEINWRYSCLI